MRSVDLGARTFATAQEFLPCERPDAAGCLILDLRLPGVSGLDFQEELAARKIDFPVVFVTGHGDIPMSVRAMKSGAVAFLTKPFREQELLEAIQHGIEQSHVVRRLNAEMRTLQQRYAFLTPREREVFPCVHRGQVMQKMKAESLAHLIHMAEKLGLGSN